MLQTPKCSQPYTLKRQHNGSQCTLSLTPSHSHPFTHPLSLRLLRYFFTNQSDFLNPQIKTLTQEKPHTTSHKPHKKLTQQTSQYLTITLKSSQRTHNNNNINNDKSQQITHNSQRTPHSRPRSPSRALRQMSPPPNPNGGYTLPGQPRLCPALPVGERAPRGARARATGSH